MSDGRGVAVLEALPRTPSRDAVLTLEQLAAVLQVSPDVAASQNFPAVNVGRGSRARWRYVYGMVLDEIAKRAA